MLVFTDLWFIRGEKVYDGAKTGLRTTLTNPPYRSLDLASVLIQPWVTENHMTSTGIKQAESALRVDQGVLGSVEETNE